METVQQVESCYLIIKKVLIDLIDHRLLLNQLATYDIPQWVLEWITDFFTHRKQRVKLSEDCFSEFRAVGSSFGLGG